MSIRILQDPEKIVTASKDNIIIKHENQYEIALKMINMAFNAGQELTIIVQHKGMMQYFDHCVPKYGAEIEAIYHGMNCEIMQRDCPADKWSDWVDKGRHAVCDRCDDRVMNNPDNPYHLDMHDDLSGNVLHCYFCGRLITGH